MYVALCYNTPAGSTREIFVDQCIYDVRIIMMICYIYRYVIHSVNLCILGDLDSRIGKLRDYVEKDYLFNLSNMFNEEIIDIFSKDNTVNDNDELLFNFCHGTSLSVVNGRVVIEENSSGYTCIKHAFSSVVNYVLCKPEMMKIKI